MLGVYSKNTKDPELSNKTTFVPISNYFWEFSGKNYPVRIRGDKLDSWVLTDTLEKTPASEKKRKPKNSKQVGSRKLEAKVILNRFVKNRK